MKPTVCCRQQPIKSQLRLSHVRMSPSVLLKAAGRRTGEEREVTEEYNDLRN